MNNIVRALTAGVVLRKTTSNHGKSVGSGSADDEVRQKCADSDVRKKHSIRLHLIRGGQYSKLDDIMAFPEPVEKFEGMGLSETLLKNLVEFMEYKTPTPIQMQAVPAIMAGNSLLIQAPTGSGKTLAYLIPMLARFQRPCAVMARGLIISPTRELAQQIVRHCKRLCRGTGFRCRIFDVVASSMKGLDIAVSTPMALIGQLGNGENLANTEILVLDEADELLKSGFDQQIDTVVSKCVFEGRQTLLVSATVPQKILNLANSLMPEPIIMEVGGQNSAPVSISQELVCVTHEQGKLSTFLQLLRTGKVLPPALVFVEEIERARQLVVKLKQEGFKSAAVMHSGLNKKERADLVDSFRVGKVWILVSTDLMSRGVDFPAVKIVINYDFPSSSESYIHRIGRTGRANRTGNAITFYTTDEIPRLKTVVGVMNQSGVEVPEFLKKSSKLLRSKLKVKKRLAIDRTMKVKTRPKVNMKVEEGKIVLVKKPKAVAKSIKKKTSKVHQVHNDDYIDSDLE